MAIEGLKTVYWYAVPQVINENFELIEEAVEALQESAGELSQAVAVANLASSTNITTVPGTFADTAAVQSYLAGANVIPNIESRIDAVEGKINSLLTALRTTGIIATP